MRNLSLLVVTALIAGCGGGAAQPGGGGAGGSTDAGAAAATGSAGADGTADAGGGLACADLFDEGTLQTYSFDISADEWSALEAEFNNLTALESGVDFAVYHPVTFHLGSETVTDAAIKLHGQSSWAQTVMFDGERAKMQFSVSAPPTPRAATPAAPAPSRGARRRPSRCRRAEPSASPAGCICAGARRALRAPAPRKVAPPPR